MEVRDSDRPLSELREEYAAAGKIENPEVPDGTP